MQARWMLVAMGLGWARVAGAQAHPPQKPWFGSGDGARRSAVLMSLVQSCRELGVNPLLYLRDVLRAVSTTPASEVQRLTPRGWKRAHGSGFSVATATPAAFVPVS